MLVERLLALPLPGLSILVADDNSPDGTGEVADKLAVEHPDRIEVVHRAGKEGLGRAYVDGIGRALDGGAEYVAQMDADLSHPPEALPGMLGALLSTQAGVVIGSRYVPGGQLDEAWPLYRRALSGWANLYVHTLLRVRIRDLTAGFKIWRADALRRHRPGPGAVQRLQLPGGDALPGHQAGAHHPGGADPLRGAARRRVQDDHRDQGRERADAVQAAQQAPQHRPLTHPTPPHAGSGDGLRAGARPSAVTSPHLVTDRRAGGGLGGRVGRVDGAGWAAGQR